MGKRFVRYFFAILFFAVVVVSIQAFRSARLARGGPPTLFARPEIRTSGTGLATFDINSGGILMSALGDSRGAADWAEIIFTTPVISFTPGSGNDTRNLLCETVFVFPEREISLTGRGGETTIQLEIYDRADRRVAKKYYRDVSRTHYLLLTKVGEFPAGRYYGKVLLRVVARAEGAVALGSIRRGVGRSGVKLHKEARLSSRGWSTRLGKSSDSMSGPEGVETDYARELDEIEGEGFVDDVLGEGEADDRSRPVRSKRYPLRRKRD